MSRRTLTNRTAPLTEPRSRAVRALASAPEMRAAVTETPTESPGSLRPDLAALTAHYQELLRLRDWKLDVSYARDLTDSAGNEVWGLCYPLADAKTAKIVIRDPETPPTGESVEEALRQVTETIVHECLHLHFAAFGNRSQTAVIAEEQAVWALAEALVSAKGAPAQEAVLARAVVAAASKLGASRAAANVTDSPRAAATGETSNMLTLDELMKAAKALGFDGSSSIDEVMAKMKGEAEPEEEAPADEPAGDPMAPAAVAQPAAPLAAAVEDDEEKAQLVALARATMALTGAKTPGAALAETTRRSRVAVDAEKTMADALALQATLDASERRRLVGELVKCGAETPAFAWANDKDSGLPDGKTPAAEYASMPLERLRAKVAARAKQAPPVAPKPPAAASGPTASLSDSERRMAADRKWNAEQTAAYVAKRDAIAARSGRKPAQTEN